MGTHALPGAADRLRDGKSRVLRRALRACARAGTRRSREAADSSAREGSSDYRWRALSRRDAVDRLRNRRAAASEKAGVPLCKWIDDRLLDHSLSRWTVKRARLTRTPQGGARLAGQSPR